jgi:wyosine [tRNA(Phe)-imidazoG37] synthetase (radical SAM superfamily)
VCERDGRRKKEEEDTEDISEEDLEKKIKEMSGQQKIEYFIKRFDT